MSDIHVYECLTAVLGSIKFQLVYSLCLIGRTDSSSNPESPTVPQPPGFQLFRGH